MLGLLRGSSLLAVAGFLQSWRTLDARHSRFYLRFRIYDLRALGGIALVLLFIPCLAGAQPAEAGTPNLPDSGWLVLLAQKYPWVTTVVALMGALRVLLKPVFAAWHAFALATGNERFEAMAVRIAGSRGLRVFAFVLDWFASVKLVPPVKVVTSVGASERPSVGASVSPVDPWPAPPPPITSSNSTKTPSP